QDLRLKMTEQNWTVEENGNFHPKWVIRYDPTPGGIKNPDGSVSFSFTSPALQVTEFVKEPKKVAHEIARALNTYPQLCESLQKLITAIDGWAATSGLTDLGLFTAAREAEVTLARVKGETRHGTSE